MFRADALGENDIGGMRNHGVVLSLGRLSMTSIGDLISDLPDLTTMSLAELRTTRSPELVAALERELTGSGTAPADEIQGQSD